MTGINVKQFVIDWMMKRHPVFLSLSAAEYDHCVILIEISPAPLFHSTYYSVHAFIRKKRMEYIEWNYYRIAVLADLTQAAQSFFLFFFKRIVKNRNMSLPCCVLCLSSSSDW